MTTDPTTPTTANGATSTATDDRTDRSTRSVIDIYSEPHQHWVGDGFHVNQLIPGTQGLGQFSDPFLMLDYNRPRSVEPTDRPGGVGSHPHRGFETVTYAIEGAVAHHDSRGNAGVIYPGDVQWMTAASGILHKEYHEQEFARRGGTFHMIQLWVNLPAEHKMSEPRYQHLAANEMGRVELDTGGSVTLIAGELDGTAGPASTFSPVYLWDVSLQPDEVASLPIPDGHSALGLVIGDQLVVDGRRVELGELVAYRDDGTHVELSAGERGARVVLFGGEPLNEPVASYGPFVMNTEAEIRQAIEDFSRGRFGRLD